MVTNESLADWIQTILVALGAPTHNAAIVASSLVESDLRGYATHGVRRLTDYAESIRRGALDPAASPIDVPTAGAAVGVVDGVDGFGQVTADRGVARVGALARQHGVGAVSLRRCHHVGRLGGWVESLAAEGLIGHAVSQSEPWVALPGTSERILGTNPLAYALPARTGPPVVVDFATSATSVGRVATAAATHRALDVDTVVDSSGRPTTDPGALFAGGALLPFGGHKGMGLSMIVDLVGGAAGGGGPASAPGFAGHHGVVLVAVDPAAWGGAIRIIDDVETLRARVGSPAAGEPPHRLPGERSAEVRAHRLISGIPLSDPWLTDLDALADTLGVDRLS